MKTLSQKLLPLLFLCLPFYLSAQEMEMEEVELNVGDTLYFGPCTGENAYKFIDRFVRTRVSPDAKSWNKSTGEGFYEAYFTSGDFDVARMKCDYKGKFGVILSIRSVQDKNTGQLRTIVFCRLENDSTIAWIEIDPATQAGEVFLQ